MGRRKEVKLSLTGGKGIFFTHGTEVVKKLSFEHSELSIQGEGFKIRVLLSKTKMMGEFIADTIIEYTEDIKEWR